MVSVLSTADLFATGRGPNEAGKRGLGADVSSSPGYLGLHWPPGLSAPGYAGRSGRGQSAVPATARREDNKNSIDGSPQL